MALQISITSHRYKTIEDRSHLFYTIKVEQAENEYEGEVEKRYSDFEALDDSLRAVSKMFPHFTFPRVPSWFRLTFIVGRELSVQEIDARKGQLAKYLVALESNPITRSTPFLAEFLEIPVAVHYRWINVHGGYVSYDKLGIPRKKLIPTEAKEQPEVKERSEVEEKPQEDEKADIESVELGEPDIAQSKAEAEANELPLLSERHEDAEVIEKATRRKEDMKEIKETRKENSEEDDCDISEEELNFDSNSEMENNSLSPPGKSTYTFLNMKPLSNIFSIIAKNNAF
eukprot:TRINITY_DN4290_c0_g1_i2.p1 TRINITY_DN4290_c0_g1~~TRINITY_DN4290_c0_g1_i2.p1  ORF type:complete len:286 (+),score=35.27 TRINITY_DN4290_c0_g1_i2:60-917(+)